MRLLAAKMLQVLELILRGMVSVQVWSRSVLLMKSVKATPSRTTLDSRCLRSTSKVTWQKVGRVTWIAVLLVLLMRQVQLMQELLRASQVLLSWVRERANFNNSSAIIGRIQINIIIAVDYELFVKFNMVKGQNYDINTSKIHSKSEDTLLTIVKQAPNDNPSLNQTFRTYLIAIIRIFIIKFIAKMNVLTASKFKTIKQKKNDIIHSANIEQSKYITPSKSEIDDTPIKSLDTHFIQKYQENRNTSIRNRATEKKEEKELPQNALLKKCFNRSRTIKSIKELEHVYESKILSKSKYRFKAEQSLLQSSNSNKSQTFSSKKKHFNDKIPVNIFATSQSIMQNSIRARSKSKDSLHHFSQSKIIKNSIIRYEE